MHKRLCISRIGCRRRWKNKNAVYIVRTYIILIYLQFPRVFYSNALIEFQSRGPRIVVKKAGKKVPKETRIRRRTCAIIERLCIFIHINIIIVTRVRRVKRKRELLLYC